MQSSVLKFVEISYRILNSEMHSIEEFLLYECIIKILLVQIYRQPLLQDLIDSLSIANFLNTA